MPSDRGGLMAKDELALQSIVKGAIEDALDFIETDIAEARNKAQRYYEGEVDIGEEDGRSTVVATKIRDTIRVILPNLMRIFLTAENPVEFVPRHPMAVAIAEQATKYCSAEFERLDGFRLLNDVILDALLKKKGFIKLWWEDEEEVEHHTYSNMTDIELDLLLQEDGVELVEQTSEMRGVEGGEVEIHRVKIKRTTTSGQLKMQVLPPEDFFIDAGATCLDDAYVYGHQTEMRISDLIEMGFKWEDVWQLGSVSGDDDTSDEKYERESYTTDEADTKLDPAMREVTVAEVFMRVDVDGDGVAEMYRFLVGGTSRKILEQEEWTGKCIACFESDPIPHLFFGNGIGDLLFDEQDSATSMLRGILDNIALVNTPRTEVDDEKVNMDDLLNNEIGGVVRSEGVGNINPLTVPFVAGDTLGAMQYFDQQVEAKTGVNSVTAGLNPDALQSTTATAVNAQVQAGANQLENIARHIAQGLSDLFRIMLDLIIENSDEQVLLNMGGGQFVPMNPATWDVPMDMKVNVGLGTGREIEKQAALNQALQIQTTMAQMGVQYLPPHMRNTVADLLAVSGVRNIDRYFPMPDPNAPPEQAPAQPQQPDPTQAIIASEQIKTQGRLQEKMMDLQFKLLEMANSDDLERDKLAQQLYIEFAQILGQYGAQVDVAAVKRAQDEPRAAPMMPGMPGMQ